MKEICLLIRCFLLVASLMVLIGLSACDRQNPPVIQPDDWRRTLADVRLQLSPGNIPIETLLQLQLRSDQPLHNVSATIVGVSMYMGKIPLRFTFDAKSGLWQSEFMLGACSDPKMLWQLQLQLTDQSGKVRQLNTEFQSSWH